VDDEVRNESRGVSRRRLLGTGGALAAGALLSRALPGTARAQRASAGVLARRSARFRTPLRIPEVLTGSELEIPIVPAKVQVLPGRKTKMWTFGGTFPGPTIRRPAGQLTRVRFDHRLPAEAGELTVHLHGGHNKAAEDGRPGGLTTAQPTSAYCDISPRLSAVESGNDVLIAPGGERTYEFEGIEDGAPERAAFHWYHDHRLDRSARNVWRGLAGMWILDDDFDAALPLPRGRHDIPLMLADRQLDSRNQLTDPFFENRKPPFDGVTGPLVLVNGAVRPRHKVKARRYRLRLLNASNFRSYNLHLTGGVRMIQIATEAGLMPAPIERDRILLGPGERVEVIADFSTARGKSVELRSDRRKGHTETGSKTWRGDLMQFRVSRRRSEDESSIPDALRPLPNWVADAPSLPSHRWKITLSGGLQPTWLINGRTYDPSYADVTVRLGDTVTWQIENRTSVAHLMHLHHTDWYLLSRNGASPPPWEQCLKETFFLDPGERIVVAGHFSDYTGPYVVHCHMLDHEDHGLMSQFEVAEPLLPGAPASETAQERKSAR
jgi:spore coat protein A